MALCLDDISINREEISNPFNLFLYSHLSFCLLIICSPLYVPTRILDLSILENFQEPKSLISGIILLSLISKKPRLCEQKSVLSIFAKFHTWPCNRSIFLNGA